MNQNGVLAPYRVLDLSDESGYSCGKILADLGADVVKIEPPGGDAARRVDPEKNLYFISYNAGKRGITLNVHSPRGRELLNRLSARADFLSPISLCSARAIRDRPAGGRRSAALGRS